MSHGHDDIRRCRRRGRRVTKTGPELPVYGVHEAALILAYCRAGQARGGPNRAARRSTAASKQTAARSQEMAADIKARR